MKQIEPHDHYIFYEREAERDRLEQAGEDCRDDIPDNDGAWATIVPPHSEPYDFFQQGARDADRSTNLINWTPCPECGQTLCHGECTQ